MRIAALAATAALLAACTHVATPPTTLESVGEYYRPGSGYALGYLHRGAALDLANYPDGLKFLPAPPASGSPASQLDESVYLEMKTLRDTPRGALAVADADLKSEAAVQAFSCALGVPISPQATPHLDMLMRRSLNDAALSTFTAKEHYARVRPFRAQAQASCTPQEEPRLKNDSYPSGHAAIGWAWALILAQVDPLRTEPLMARGYAYGQSRLICGVHWASDVAAGRLAGAAAVARLQSEPVFQAQLALARDEVARARALGLRPARDCGGELEALAMQPASALR